ncbi:hypothetical protein [Devosia sp.]|uniref:hypothetical protein n=1 Tax=Devosia sp. TaxID=1871048 RepID=UPI003263EB59
MQMNGKITNGLAWAGVIVVVGVLSADFVTSRFAPSASVVAEARVPDVFPLPASARPKPVAVAEASKPAVVARPAQAIEKPIQVANSAVVNDFLATGKKLPSYITDATQAVATPAQPVVTKPAIAQPAPVQTAAIQSQAAAIDPIQVSSIAPHKIAPVPMPLSMRPTQAEAPLIIDQTTTASIQKPRINSPVPQIDMPKPPTDIVSADDLQDWETGPLSEFLVRQRGGGQASSQYDADGFFLGDGPNDRNPRPHTRDRNLGPVRSSAQYNFFSD